MLDPARRRARDQLVVATVVVNALVFVLSRPFALRKGLHDLIGVVFLFAALHFIRRDDDDTARHGVRMGGLFPGRAGDPRSLLRTLWESIPEALREVAVALGVAAVVLPVYAYAWPYFNHPIGPRRLGLDGDRWRELATELLAVAFTEEVLFRGFVLTRLGDLLGERQLTLRSPRPALVKAVVGSSALFALTHVVVEPTVPRAVVFFPGLLFGALRVWRGGVGAAVVLHALSNLFERWLEGR
ncbi:MAG: MrtC family glutamic-type intramembrane protease [Polyangiales bacterium]